MELLPILSPPPRMKIVSVLAKTSEKIEIELCLSALFHMKTRFCVKYFANHSLQV